MSAILRLRDEGKINLDAPAVDYLPILDKLGYPNDEVRGFSVRELLTHTSGLPRVGDFDFESPAHRVDREEIEQSLNGFDLVASPGETRRYSNLGFILLGLLIEDVTGEDYRSYLGQTFLAPLGMQSSAWSASEIPTGLATPYDYQNGQQQQPGHEDHGAASAGGGLYSTVEDLARFARLQLNAWPPRHGEDHGPLRRASVREAHQIHRPLRSAVEISSTHAPFPKVGGQGLAWYVIYHCRLGHLVVHNGRNTGYSAVLQLLPKRGVGLVLLSNQHSTDLSELGTALLEVLAKNPALTLRHTPFDPRLKRRAQELFAYGSSGDEPRLRSLLSSDNWEDKQIDALFDRWRNVRDRVGPCESADSIDGSGATQVVIRTTCQHGRVRVEAQANAQGFTTISIYVEQDDPPKAAQQAAANIGKLLIRWDEALASQTFTPRGRPSRYRSFFRAVGRTRGQCKIGPVLVASDRDVEYRLDCTHRSGRLKLMVTGDTATNVSGLWIRDAPADPRMCVPG